MQNPARFVHPDPDLPQVLLDMRQAGKTLLLITNSGFDYTEAVMQYAMQSYLPEGLTSWRELFDIIIINANKPDFFKGQQALHEVVTSDGLMRPARSLKRGGLYSGGSARQVEQSLGASGDSILYVGDHLYSDVQLAKKWESQWRTCLILRELEEEIDALAAGRQHHARLKDLLNKKEQVGDAFNNLRLAKQRSMAGQQRQEGPGPWMDEADGARVNEALAELLNIMDRLDAVIVPAIEADGAHFNVRWGHLTRAGVNDRSQLQRQVEKYADLYTSRVSNFGRYSPYFYFRSPSQAVVHDRPAADEKLKQRRAKKAGTTNGNSADSTTDGDGVGDHEPLHEALV